MGTVGCDKGRCVEEGRATSGLATAPKESPGTSVVVANVVTCPFGIAFKLPVVRLRFGLSQLMSLMSLGIV